MKNLTEGLRELAKNIKNHGYCPTNRYSIQDGLYDGILKVLAGCIKPKDNHQSISKQETQDIIESLRHCYRGGSRNEIIFALCGLCRKNNISKESIRSLIDALAIDDEALGIKSNVRERPKNCKRY